MIPVGFTLQPDEVFLDLLADVVRRDVDYYEVAPETLWRTPADPDGPRSTSGASGPDEPALRPGLRSTSGASGPDEPALRPGPLEENGFHRAFAALGARTGKPFVAHGVGFSLGTSARADAARRRRWLARIRADHAVFRFRWYTDHLGTTSLGGLAATLPLPLPMTAHAAAVVRRSLAALRAVVPDVGVENSVSYFLLGDPLDEPAFLARILQAPGTHLLLDLHNVFTMAQNFGFDPAAWIARIDLAKVIEIHLSGGSPSDPAWLPSRRVLRLDGHDAAVPEPVWRLFEDVAPRCPRLRGVTLERMEGTVTADDVPQIRAELRRARRVLRRLH